MNGMYRPIPTVVHSILPVNPVDVLGYQLFVIIRFKPVLLNRMAIDGVLLIQVYSAIRLHWIRQELITFM